MGGIAGIGLDMVSAARLTGVLERHGRRFVDRLLSDTERQDLAGRSLSGARLAEYLAGRFAAKEAVAKALGCGIGALGWSNIEVMTPQPHAAPRCRLTGHAADYADRNGITAILISITHESGSAAACAIALTA